MIQRTTSRPEASQSQTLRSWFLWTIAGTLLCGIFWCYQLDHRHQHDAVHTTEAATNLPDLGAATPAPTGKFQINPLKPE